MFDRRLRAVLIMGLMVVFVSPVFSWDETGHKITAFIAWQQMTPEVRARTVRIMLAARGRPTFDLLHGVRLAERRGPKERLLSYCRGVA